MIRKPTVFVVGAGASAPYGMPLGAELVRQMVDGMGENGFLRPPLRDAGFEGDELTEFAAKLLCSRLTSIDAFLEHNLPRYQEIGRVAIATTILFRERDAALKILGGPLAGDWLTYVWNTMKASASSGTFAHNDVTFVTFNYDRAVEYFFDWVLENAFNLLPHEAAALREKTFQVIHLHGVVAGVRMGEFPEPLSGQKAMELGRGIRIIHDPVPQADKEFAAAYSALEQAERICLLGFGYHPDNIVRLRLNHLPGSAQLHGSVYKMGRAEIDAAKVQIGRGIGHEDRELDCLAFLRQNVLLD